MRIGILGGTFNPVHNGHLYIAKKAIQKLNLSKVIFIPTYLPPHKRITGNATFNDRLNMLRLATRGKKQFAISMYEIKRKGKSYSIRTARFLKRKYGKNAKFFFLIGADSLTGLKRWKNIESLSKLVRFVVFPRSEYAMTAAFKNILKIDIPEKNISSSDIRRLIRKAKPIKSFVPKKVYEYIKEKNLYVK